MALPCRPRRRPSRFTTSRAAERDVPGGKRFSLPPLSLGDIPARWPRAPPPETKWLPGKPSLTTRLSNWLGGSASGGSESLRSSPEQSPQMSRSAPPACLPGLLERHLSRQEHAHQPDHDLDSPDDQPQAGSSAVARQVTVVSKEPDEDLGKREPRHDDQQDPEAQPEQVRLRRCSQLVHAADRGAQSGAALALEHPHAHHEPSPPHSAGSTSRTVCVSSQRWPNGSSTTQERSPYS